MTLQILILSPILETLTLFVYGCYLTVQKTTRQLVRTETHLTLPSQPKVKHVVVPAPHSEKQM